MVNQLWGIFRRLTSLHFDPPCVTGKLADCPISKDNFRKARRSYFVNYPLAYWRSLTTVSTSHSSYA
jgi:hypothetical protein